MELADDVADEEDTIIDEKALALSRPYCARSGFNEPLTALGDGDGANGAPNKIDDGDGTP